RHVDGAVGGAEAVREEADGIGVVDIGDGVGVNVGIDDGAGKRGGDRDAAAVGIVANDIVGYRRVHGARLDELRDRDAVATAYAVDADALDDVVVDQHLGDAEAFMPNPDAIAGSRS